MKKLLITVLLSQISIFAGGDWLFVNSPTNQNLTRVSFADSLYGWISGDSGSFYLTNTGGESWIPVNIGTNLNIVDHFFIDKKTGWAVTQEIDTITFIGSSKLYQTRDSGYTWQVYPFNQEDLFITKIYFFDTLRGLAGSGRGEIFYTENGGERWEPTTFDTNSTVGFKIINFDFYDDQYGYACGGQYDAAGTIFRTTNGGMNWYGKLVNSEPVHSIRLFDSLNGLAFTGDFDYGTSIMKTSDAGLSWIRDTVNFFGIPEASAQRSNNEIWASLGFTGEFMYTEDSMRTWHSVFVPDTTRINDIFFPDTLHGFAVGMNGKIFKYKYKEPILVYDDTPEIVSSFQVSCYPNPFNPSTTIEYNLPVRELVTIRLFDILGRDAGLIFYGEQQPGTYKQPVSAAKLSAGVYICSITTGKESRFIKLLYLK